MCESIKYAEETIKDITSRIEELKDRRAIASCDERGAIDAEIDWLEESRHKLQTQELHLMNQIAKELCSK